MPSLNLCFTKYTVVNTAFHQLYVRCQVRLLTFFAPLQNAVGFLKCHPIFSNNQVFTARHHLYNYITRITHKRFVSLLPKLKFTNQQIHKLKVKEKAYLSKAQKHSARAILNWFRSPESPRSKNRVHIKFYSRQLGCYSRWLGNQVL